MSNLKCWIIFIIILLAVLIAIVTVNYHNIKTMDNVINMQSSYWQQQNTTIYGE